MFLLKLVVCLGLGCGGAEDCWKRKETFSAHTLGMHAARFCLIDPCCPTRADFSNAPSARWSDLVVKCLIKITKALPTTIDVSCRPN